MSSHQSCSVNKAGFTFYFYDWWISLHQSLRSSSRSLIRSCSAAVADLEHWFSSRRRCRFSFFWTWSESLKRDDVCVTDSRLVREGRGRTVCAQHKRRYANLSHTYSAGTFFFTSSVFGILHILFPCNLVPSQFLKCLFCPQTHQRWLWGGQKDPCCFLRRGRR